ncbi:MAG: PAS domain S-box protein [Chloroflexi bacterium]|nr:PAS domain S-box protein [Chloroflexota bacterium]
MRRLLLTLLLVPFLLVQPASAKEAGATLYPGVSLRFEHLTIDDGLSQSAGLALLQDSQGYLWIGSQDGLNRYDGYHITQFKHDPENPDTLGFNSIIELYESSDGFLWIGTWGGGLDRYDPHTGKFSHYRPGDDPSSAVVTAIVEVDGALWVGSLGGLSRFDLKSGSFTPYPSDPADPSTLSSNAISAIVPAEDGQLWVGTGAYGTEGAGLNLFDPRTGKAKRIPATGQCLRSPNISKILTTPQGPLWIALGGYAVSGGGIDRFDPTSGSCTHYENVSAFGNQITDNNFTDLLLDSDGALWASSWSSGVWRMDLSRPGRFDGIRHNPADPDSLSNDNTFSLLQDHSGVVWIGTLSAGINKFNPASLQFRTYRNDASNPNSLPSNHVGSFAETSDGSLWVGTWENGLAHFNPFSGSFQRYQSHPEDPESLSSDLVMSLYADADGTLWIGTLGGGLNHFDPRTEKFIRYQKDPAHPNSLLDDQVTNITRDVQGRLWVATMSGLSRLDPGRSDFVNYPMSAPAVQVRIIDNLLWIGTWGGGVSRLDLSDTASLDPAKATFTTLTNDPANPNSLSENSVWAIHRTADSLMWFGTQGGLSRYDPQTGDFKTYTEKDGLRNATILGIMEDAKGNLWLTTNNGLARFDPRTETFRIYDKSDGLQGNEFNSNGWYLSPSTGDIYVGGVSGFSVFDPQTLRGDSVAPNIVITDFSVFNTPHEFDSTGQSPIRLNYDQNFISFEFAALDFQSPRKNQYAYKLEGFDKDWVQTGTRNYASYTNLPGGEYTFRVKAANSDGIWNEEGTSLKLTVIPPFWQTRPFQVGAILGLILLVVAGFQWRIRAVREQNARLQQMVDDQKRVEAELRESEARFKAMFEHAAMGIALIGLDRRPIAINDAFIKMTGYSREESAHLSGADLTYPPDAHIGEVERQAVLENKLDVYQIEKRYIHKDGHIFWVRITTSVVREADGTAKYVLTMTEDIDERKRKNEELRESEARFRSMFDNAAVGVAVMSLDRHITQVNQTATRITGYSAAELMSGDPTWMAVDEDKAIDRDLFAELVAGKRDQYTVEKRYTRKDGNIFWGRVNFSAVRGMDGHPLYIIGIIEDISEEKRAAERLAAQEAEHRRLLEQRITERTQELNLANERLREKAAQDAVTAERTRLARDLHDAVTQTLFSTTLIADVLPDLWEMNPAEGHRRLEEVRQLTRGALAEMRTLLVELRPNALVEVPLPTLLRQLTEALAGRARIHIQLSAEGERKLPADVQVGLYRIAQEALNNVFKHAKASQAVVTLRLGESVRLTIADDGAGFDPSTVTADHLGVKIMRERAEAIGAKFSIYSEPGEGTQISVVWS